MKQTAVDWLYENIKSHFEKDQDLLESLMVTVSIAKIKEREQITDAYGDGLNAHRNDFCNRDEYYNKKYNKKENYMPIANPHQCEVCSWLCTCDKQPCMCCE